MLEVLAKRLFDTRKEKGLTQKEVAEKVGITATALSAYEKAQREPSLGVILRISQFYGVSVDSLCGIQVEQKAKESKPFSQADVFRMITTICEKVPDVTLETRVDPYLTATSQIIFNAVNCSWLKIFCDKYISLLRLYKSGDIDQEMLEAFKAKRFAEYESKIIYDDDDELPF